MEYLSINDLAGIRRRQVVRDEHGMRPGQSKNAYGIRIHTDFEVRLPTCGGKWYRVYLCNGSQGFYYFYYYVIHDHKWHRLTAMVEQDFKDLLRPSVYVGTTRGFLKKDEEEVFNGKRTWWRNAWRIVDVFGDDMIQPWARSKQEARARAEALNILLVER